MWDDITAAFDEVGLQWGDAVRGAGGRAINLVTPEASKGLEFDVVLLVGPQSIIDQDHGARLLYIAMTRTTNYLEVVAPLDEIPDILHNAFSYVNLLEETYLEPEKGGGTIEPDPDAAVDVAQVEQCSPANDAVENRPPGGALSGTDDVPEDEERPSIPTPRDLLRSTTNVRTEANTEGLRDGAEGGEERPTHISAVQYEFVHRNALYLAEIVRDSFGPTLRLAVPYAKP